MLWTSTLSGSWVAEQGVAGTVPSQGEAYTASAGSLAVLGYGTTVTGYQARTGRQLWVANLAGLTPGSVIVSLRAWPTAVAVGVSVPASNGTGQVREEIILSAATGLQLRSYPAAYYGGAAMASTSTAVIVGADDVTSYANATGKVLWRRRTGTAAQAWQVSGQYLYITQSSKGYLSSSPVTSLLRIDLGSGAHRLIRPVGHAFEGTLAAAEGGVLFFADDGGLWAYSAQTGALRWHRSAAVLELTDQSGESVYIATGNDLVAVNIRTGHAIGRPATSVSAGLYAVKNGIALGLDEDALGEAWGYSIADRRAVWTSASLPWPHFFVDLTGLGGSIGRGSSVTLLTTCAAPGPSTGTAGTTRCLRPELAAIEF